MANEVVGCGTTFSGTALGAVATCRDIEGPNEEAADIDVASNEDMVTTAGKNFRRRFRPGPVDPGEIKVTVVYVSTLYDAARDNIRVLQAFTITTETGSTLVTGNECYVKSVSPQYPWEKEAVFDLVIKVSGEATFTP